MSSIVETLSKKGFLLSPDLNIPENEEKSFFDFILKVSAKESFLVVDRRIYNNFKGIILSSASQEKLSIDEKPVRVLETSRINQKREDTPANVELIKNYTQPKKIKTDINDFVSYFNNRYFVLRNILTQRLGLKKAVSISRIIETENREEVCTIGLISGVHLTSGKNYVFTIEDPSGTTFCLVKSESKCFKICDELVDDEVVGILGTKSGRYLYINEIFFPDIPLNEPHKPCPDDVSVVFTSDTHIGSIKFLEKEFGYFIKWLKGEVGNARQQEESSKVKYLFVNGDLVDGIGVYPEQEKELKIKDIYKQYDACAEFLRQVPDNIIKIIIPGNHDAVRLEEPQHALYQDFAKSLYEIPNVVMVSNPSVVKIHRTSEFQGLKVLAYHGMSFNYYIDNLPKLRNSGGVDRPDLVMEFLLKKRHLAPTFSSTVFAPTSQDYLVIDSVPDIFVSAHLHKAKIGKYNNVINIASSCFQARTSFQEKLGLHPEPAFVPYFNLKDYAVKMMKFCD